MNERQIFEEALDYADSAARQDFLNRACGSDEALRARVEALLQSHESASLFLRVPAAKQLQKHSEDTEQTIASGGAHAPDGEDLEDDSAAAPDLIFLSPSSGPGSLGILGHYEILQLLGQGAFGQVFKAFDGKLHRHVAIKVMNRQLATTSPPRKRFLREARSAAAIKHENIVQVYSVEEQPLPYLVMEYIDGQTLKERLDQTGPLEVAEILHLGRQMASALAAAHAQGLIHRDIKPGNILIEGGAESKVKITDFGLARAADDATMTRTGVISGTPLYMAPEQAQGLALDHRADLFSLGSVLYQLACGRPPFRGSSTVAVLRRVTDEAPRPIQEIIPEVPDWLCAIIAKLHAKKPEDRFQSAKEVAELLSRCQASLQQQRQIDLPENVASFLPHRSAAAEPVAAPSLAPVEKPAVVRAPRELSHRWGLAAAVLVALLTGLGLSEATGVTNVRGTVIRLLSPDGTLVVEVDDPGVKVRIDGEEMIISGAGAKEIRLKPGQHQVQASKDGKVVSQELVTVTKNGRQVVRVSREANPVDSRGAQATPAFHAADYADLATGKWAPVLNSEDDFKRHRVREGEFRFKEGVVECDSGSILFPTHQGKNVILRARVKHLAGQNIHLVFFAPETDYSAWWHEGGGLFGIGKYGTTGTGDLTIRHREGVPDEFFEFAFAAVNRKLIAYVDGRKLMEADMPESEATIVLPGLGVLKGRGLFKNIEIMVLEGAATGSSVAGPVIVAPSAPLDRLRREQRSPDALLAAGDGDPQLAPPQLMAVLGQPNLTHQSNSGEECCLAVSPDGRWLATGTGDRRILLRDAGTARVVQVLAPHASLVRRIAFSADSKTIVAAVDDGSLKLWHIDEKGQPGTPRIVPANLKHNSITALAASRDGRFLAAGSWNGHCKLWKWGDWESPIDLPGRSDAVLIRGLVFSPDGKHIAIGGAHSPWLQPREDADLSLHVFATDSLEEVWKYEPPVKRWDGAGVSAAAYSHDGKHLAAHCFDNFVRIFEAETGKLVAEMGKNKKVSYLHSLAWSPDDTLVAIGVEGEAQVDVYDVASRTLKKRVQGIRGGDIFEPVVFMLAFTPDGKTLAASHNQGALSVWNTTTWELKDLDAGHRHRVWSVAVHPDGQSLLTAGDDGTVRVWDLNQPGTHRRLALPDLNRPVAYAAWSRDGQRLVAASKTQLLVRDLKTGKDQLIATTPRQIHRTVADPGGNYLAAVDIDGFVCLWDLARASVHRFPVKGKWCQPAFSPDGKLLAAADEQAKKVTVWETASGNEMASWPVEPAVAALAFDPAGARLVTGHANGTLRAWDWKAGRQAHAYGGHDKAVTQLTFSLDGGTLFSAAVDGTIHVWNKAESRVRETFRVRLGVNPSMGHPLAFDVDPSGRYLFVIGSSPAILVLRRGDVPGGTTSEGAAPDRRAAEWVLSVGGGVQVNEFPHGIINLADLPARPFELTGVWLPADKKVADEDLANFQGCKNIRILHLGFTLVSDQGLANFRDCKRLTTLYLVGPQITDDGLANLQGCKDLEFLSLYGLNVSGAGLANFQGCQKLSTLEIHNMRLDAAGLAHLNNRKHLKIMNLAGTWLRDSDLVSFNDCPQLAYVGLRQTNVGDAGLLNFTQCQKLETIDLSETKVTDEGLDHLKKVATLRWVVVRQTKVSAEGVKKLQEALPQCKIEWDGGVIEPKTTLDADRRAAEWVLSLGGIVFINDGVNHVRKPADLPEAPFRFTGFVLRNPKVTDADLHHLKDCQHLARIDLQFTGISDAGLELLPKSRPLTTLGLLGTRVTDAGLARLAPCNELAEFSIGSPFVTDEGIAKLGDYQQLVYLWINGGKFTDAALLPFKRSQRLTMVDIQWTQIGDEGIAHLQGCRNLANVWAKHSKVTARGAWRLQAALANCKVDLEDIQRASDRRAAEFVLSIPREHAVTVQVDDVDRWIGSASDLPTRPFRLTGVFVEWAAKLDDEGLANFAGCKHLKILRLWGTQATEKGLRNFKDCQELRELSLTSDTIKDEAIEIFQGRQLSSLHVQSKHVTDAGLAHFQGLTGLQALALNHSPVSDVALAYFSGNKGLKVLSLGDTGVTDAGLAHFLNCAELETLILFQTRVTDAGLAHFKDCVRLKRVELGRAPLVSDAGLVHFQGCAGLNHLALEGTAISDDGLTHLKQMKELTFLRLDDTKVSDAGLAHLEPCKRLAELNLAQTRVNGAGLVHLRELPNLTRLNLAQCPVTDEAIAALGACSKLRVLDLAKTRLTAAGVNRLAAALPLCVIFSDHGAFGPGQ